jgi:cellulose biosynthesis protein BcsQ
MKMIAYCSFKGGAGKTTALMAMCSSLVASGTKIALFEADQNRPLQKWQQNALANDTWDELCQLFIADETEALEQAYSDAVAQECQYALVDTQGGSSELNNIIVASADFLILPTALTALDIDETLATYRYIVELLMNEELDTPSAVLKQRVPVGRLTMSQTTSDQMLEALPLFSEVMHDRDAFAAMKLKGMLHKTTEKLKGDPQTRLQLRNHLIAMNEVDALTRFVTDRF